MKQQFHIGEYIVRPDDGIVTDERRTVRIEPRAMDVLVCLYEHAGEVLSREAIIGAVWGHSHVTDDVLTRCISLLRQALGDERGNPRFIETIPKRGYRLLAPSPARGSPSGERRLAAVMFTDLVGYTALAQRDERLAIELLQEHRGLLRPLFATHGGEEIKTTGDGFLVLFPSALQATEAALAIQAKLASTNEAASPGRHVAVRIGIHLGDVEYRDGDVLGDGVNIAARIEPLAGGGGICVSADVARQVRGRTDAVLETLGPQKLKNIFEPIEVFKVRNSIPSAPVNASQESSPSIAVLPFSNLSPEPENEYFSDGITEELIDALSRIPGLKVIARTSVFALKGKQLDVREIGVRLGVSSILEGSVRRSGDRLRINAQLVQVSDHSRLWSERYDRASGDVFEIQEDIARAITHAIAPRLHQPGAAPGSAASAVDPAAYDALLQGRFYCDRRTNESLHQAVACFERALAIQPDYAPAFAGLARAWGNLAGYAYTDIPAGRRLAEQYARKALDQDPELAEAHESLAIIRFYLDWDFAGAEQSYRRAIEIKRGNGVTLSGLAILLCSLNRGQEADSLIEEALEYDPLSPLVHMSAVVTRVAQRDYVAAAQYARRAIEIDSAYRVVAGYAAIASLLDHNLDDAETFARDEQRPYVQHMLHALISHERGDTPASDAALESLVEGHQYDSAYQIAIVHFWRGEIDSGFDWLWRAIRQRDPGLVYLQLDPVLDPIRGDRRYREAREAVGFPA